jgi:hypothetical protein
VTSALDDDELFDALDKSPLIGAVNTFEMKVGDHPAAGIEWTVRRGGKSLTTRLVVVFLGKEVSTTSSSRRLGRVSNARRRRSMP